MKIARGRGVHVESILREVHPESGSRVIQLTNAAFIHSHIYPEAPVFTPDSRRFIYYRFQSLDRPKELWLCDLENLELIRLTRGAQVFAPVVSFDGKCSYYIFQQAETKLELKRVSLETFEEESICTIEGYRFPYTLGTIDPKSRWFVTSVKVSDKEWGLLRVDLEERSASIIHKGTEIFNPHMQFNPKDGKDILVQHNRGGLVRPDGRWIRPFGRIGKTIYLVDYNGENIRRLNIGHPYSRPTQGHQCCIGSTDRIISTLSFTNREEAKRVGNLVSIAVGDEKPRTVAKAYYFSHVHASRDGRWFVCDERESIIVGSIATGRTGVLCRHDSSFGRPQYTHPHPFFSSDARYVLFNSDHTGLGQIYAASVEKESLEKLES